MDRKWSSPVCVLLVLFNKCGSQQIKQCVKAQLKMYQTDDCGWNYKQIVATVASVSWCVSVNVGSHYYFGGNCWKNFQVLCFSVLPVKWRTHSDINTNIHLHLGGNRRMHAHAYIHWADTVNSGGAGLQLQLFIFGTKFMTQTPRCNWANITKIMNSMKQLQHYVYGIHSNTFNLSEGES